MRYQLRNFDFGLILIRFVFFCLKIADQSWLLVLDSFLRDLFYSTFAPCIHECHPRLKQVAAVVAFVSCGLVVQDLRDGLLVFSCHLKCAGRDR